MKCYGHRLFAIPFHLILSDCLADLRSGGPLVIVANFDCFFSVLRSVHKIILYGKLENLILLSRKI